MASLIDVQTRGWMIGLHTSRCKDFAFHHQIQADCISNPASYPTYTEVSFALNNTTQAYTPVSRAVLRPCHGVYTLLVMFTWLSNEGYCLVECHAISIEVKYWSCRGTCCLNIQRRQQIPLKCQHVPNKLQWNAPGVGNVIKTIWHSSSRTV